MLARMEKKSAETGTQSLSRALELLRIVASRSRTGLRLVEAVEQTGLTRPTVHRLLQALTHQGFTAYDPASRRYHLGPEAFVIGTLANERFGIHRAALPCLLRLAAESEDTAFLSVIADRHSVCLHREEGPFPIRSHVLQVGDRHPLGVGSGSLAMLAALPPNEAEAIIVQNTPELEASFPGFPPEFIREQVRLARERGYAVNPGMLTAGSWGVAVAVINRAGQCEGALSIAAIESRLESPRCDRIVSLLTAEARRLAAQLERPAGATNVVSRAHARPARR